MNEVPLIVLIVSISGPLWFLVCNERTFRQRMRMLMVLRCDLWAEEFEAALDAYRAVSYERHRWHLLTFRDPAVLYSDGARRLIAEWVK